MNCWKIVFFSGQIFIKFKLGKYGQKLMSKTQDKWCVYCHLLHLLHLLPMNVKPRCYETMSDSSKSFRFIWHKNFHICESNLSRHKKWNCNHFHTISNNVNQYCTNLGFLKHTQTYQGAFFPSFISEFCTSSSLWQPHKSPV